MPYRVVGSFQTFTASATSQDASFPATYVNSYPYAPFRIWKSGSGGQQDFTIDVGSGQQVNSLFATPAIFLDNLNVSSLLIQAHTALGSWDAPAWQVGVGIQTELYTGQKRFAAKFSDLAPNSAMSFRYVNLRISSQVPSSGTVYQIGTLLLGTGPDLSADPLYPVERKLMHPILANDYPDGGREVLSMGAARLEFSIPTVAVDSSELRGLLAIDRMGMHKPFVIWDATTSGTADAWLVRRTQPRAWTEQFLTQYQGAWTLEEVV